jgi:hypothetical protein
MFYLRILKNFCIRAISNTRVDEGFEDFASLFTLICSIRLTSMLSVYESTSY